MFNMKGTCNLESLIIFSLLSIYLILPPYFCPFPSTLCKTVLCRSGVAVDLTIDRKATDPEEIARIAEAGVCMVCMYVHVCVHLIV